VFLVGTVLALLDSGACGKRSEAPAEKAGSAAMAAADPACEKAEKHGDLAWLEDDYASALACAKSKHVPLVVDLWAPWCHTCLSMKTTVFIDEAMAPQADKFVWLSLDTDREGNAAAVAKLPLSAWPTFYVLGEDESVLARFAGAASLEQFTAFLDAGLAARTATDGSAQALLAAERALAVKDLATADTQLEAAIKAAPPTWSRLPDALVSWVHTKRSRKDNLGCLTVAETYLQQTGRAASVADFIGISLECAKDVLKADPASQARVDAFRVIALNKLFTQYADTGGQLSIDDRSDAMTYARELLVDMGNKDEAKSVAQEQVTLLEKAIKDAPDPSVAATYLYQLSEAYIALDRPLEAVPTLQKYATALPKEYDPAMRLANVYVEAKRYEDAKMWADKALSLVYGPRKSRVLEIRASIAHAQNKPAEEKLYRTQAVDLWKSLPPGQQNPDALKKAEDALAALDAPATGSGSASAADAAAARH
jgi:thioredoxin-like negative regulator of GroEL